VADMTGIWLMVSGGDNAPGPREDAYDAKGSNFQEGVIADPAFVEPSIRRLLLGVNASESAWMTEGHCASAMHDEWFASDEDEPGENNNASLRVAQRICSTCPVRQKCLEWGIKYDEQGIWGGYGQKTRRQIRRDRAKAPA